MYKRILLLLLPLLLNACHYDYPTSTDNRRLIDAVPEQRGLIDRGNMTDSRPLIDRHQYL